MQHAPITTPITDKLASMTWIRWFRQLVDRVDEIKGTADAPAWVSITGKPDEFPPEPHTHAQYLTGETDPTVPAHVKDISEADIARWDEADQFVTAGGCQLAGVTGEPIGDLVYIAPIATILGETYRVNIMPDGNEWLCENVRNAPYKAAEFAHPYGSTFTQNGINNLNDVSLAASDWRVATESDWAGLCTSIGATESVTSGGASTTGNYFYDRVWNGNNVGQKLKSAVDGWVDPYKGADFYGFAIIPAEPGGWPYNTSVRLRVYYPDYDVYTPTWGVVDNSAAVFRYGQISYNNSYATRLVRTPPEGYSYGIQVPSFRIRLFDDDSFLTLAKEYDVAEQLIPPPGDNQRYYLCAQRSGDTVTLVSVPQADVYTINMSNIVPLWRFEIHGTELHQIHYDNMGDGLPNKQEFAQLRTEPYRLAVEGGFVATLGAGRSLAMTGAEVFFGHHRVTVDTFDSATDTVHDFYHVAGVWDDTETVGGWAWDNLNYDNGTALTPLGNNKWGAIFVYRSIGDDKEIFVVRGQTEANHIEGARLIGIPPTPDLIQWHCMLVGRILFEKSATTAIFEEYRPASFIRATTPSLSLNDLTDVDTTGAVTGDILVLQSDGIWRPQAP